MAVPNWWQAALLLLAAYRWTRLIGWDDFPPIAKLRDRVLYNRTWRSSSERVKYPTLDHFVHCPFCVGFWITLMWWMAWQVWPHGTLVTAAPFALAAGVGLVSKNLDA